MAALRIFARSELTSLFRAHAVPLSAARAAPILNQIDKRWSSYNLKDLVKSDETYTDFEISRDPKEWEYVKRLLRAKVVPEPNNSTDLPSGWKPRTCKPTDHPYFIQRTRNHMQPVYLVTSFRGMRHITHIRKIHGDIWALHKELQAQILAWTSKKPGFQVNELVGDIKIRGDYVNLVKHWMDTKGF